MTINLLPMYIFKGSICYCRFQDICVGWPGRVHDARVFANSSLYDKGNNGTLFPRVSMFNYYDHYFTYY